MRFANVFAIGLALIGLPALADDKVGESPYYPTKIGSTWTYKAAGGMKIVAKIAKHEKKSDHMCALLETSVNGNVVATEHIAISKDGVLRVAFGDQIPDQPVMILKFSAKKGESWDTDLKVGTDSTKGKMTRGEEDVDVPAHKGKAVSVKGEFEVNGQKLTMSNWFVEKKGIVKIEVAAGGQNILMELESFEEGK